MLANYLIGLREGLEAALVVSILVAYLVRTDRRSSVRSIWWGVALAVAVSLVAGAVLTFTSAQLPAGGEAVMSGTVSVLAVALVTWMLFWMRRAARGMASELRGKVDAAVAMGAGAVAMTAFAAVAREGLETALFVWAAVGSAGPGVATLTGLLLGIATATALGALLYRRAITLNLTRFFTITGVFLVLIAGRVLAHGIGDLREAGAVTVLGRTAFDTTGHSALGAVTDLLVGVVPTVPWLELGAWALYVAVTLVVFLRPARPASAAGTTPSATTPSAAVR